MTGASVAAAAGALYELAFWAEVAGAGALTLAVGPPGAKGRLELVANASGARLDLRQGGQRLGSHDIAATGQPEGGIVAASWNMLRLHVTPGRARAWINPQFPDVTGASVPPADERAPPVPMPPRIDVTGVQAGAGAASLVATGGAFRVDYVSILPPELYSM